MGTTREEHKESTGGSYSGSSCSMLLIIIMKYYTLKWIQEGKCKCLFYPTTRDTIDFKLVENIKERNSIDNCNTNWQKLTQTNHFQLKSIAGVVDNNQTSKLDCFKSL